MIWFDINTVNSGKLKQYRRNCMTVCHMLHAWVKCIFCTNQTVQQALGVY